MIALPHGGFGVTQRLENVTVVMSTKCQWIEASEDIVYDDLLSAAER